MDVVYCSNPNKKQRVISYTNHDTMYQFPYPLNSYVEKMFLLYKTLVLTLIPEYEYLVHYEWEMRDLSDVVPGETGYQMKFLKRRNHMHDCNITVCKKKNTNIYFYKMPKQKDVPTKHIRRVVILRFIQHICSISCKDYHFFNSINKFICFSEHINFEYTNKISFFQDIPLWSNLMLDYLLNEDNKKELLYIFKTVYTDVISGKIDTFNYDIEIINRINHITSYIQRQ